MPRLYHSYAGHLRSMQISSIQLHVFVEGKQCDPFFFAEICSLSLDPDITFNIATAQQIPGDSGGKQTLLSFFTHLRKKSSLISSLGGKQTACIFFIDKDVDDLQRIKKRSPHIVYTKYYDIQNYIFEYGDIAKGSAAAASVDIRRLERELGDSSRWCKHIAGLWKDWVALCLHLLEEEIPGEANFSVLSRVQDNLSGPTDNNKLNTLIGTIARRVGMPVNQFRSRFQTSRQKVDQYLRRNDHHRIFKGKWFSSVLADDIRHIMAGDPYDAKALNGRLTSAVAVTLDFTQPWADDFKIPLLNIAAELKGT